MAGDPVVTGLVTRAGEGAALRRGELDASVTAVNTRVAGREGTQDRGGAAGDLQQLCATHSFSSNACAREAPRRRRTAPGDRENAARNIGAWRRGLTDLRGSVTWAALAPDSTGLGTGPARP